MANREDYMSLRVWTAGKEFENSHERRALYRLYRQMFTAFDRSPDPYALFIDFTVKTSKIDLLALTSRAIVIIDLKQVDQPDGEIVGTENGAWEVRYPAGGQHVLNAGRANPFVQVDGYRWHVIEWLESKGDTLFGAQRRSQMALRQVAAWLVFAPGVDARRSMQNLMFLNRDTEKWFKLVAIDQFSSELFAEKAPGIRLGEEDFGRIAAALGLVPRTNLYDLQIPQWQDLPDPRLFSPLPAIRYHLDRDGELQTLLETIERPECSVLYVGGPAGVGKKHVVAKLGQLVATERRLFWVECDRHAEMSLETLLSAFAREMDDSRLAQMVVNRDEPETIRMDIVLQYCERVLACLVLTDYHLVSASSGLDRFIQRLDETCRQAKVVVTACRRPSFGHDVVAPIRGCYEFDVRGLPAEDVVAYLRHSPAHFRLQISDEDGPAIWEQTGGGIPQVLDILAALSVGRSPADVARNMPVFSSEKGVKWFESLLGLATPAAHRLASAASVLTRPADRDTLAALVAALLNDKNPDALIEELVDSYVFYCDPCGKEYSLNELLRQYLWNGLHPVERSKSHRAIAVHMARLADEPRDERERVELCAQAVEHAQAGGDSPLVLKLARSAIEPMTQWGELPRAKKLCEWALAAAESKQGSRLEIARWSVELARHLSLPAESARAEALCLNGLKIADELHSKGLCANAYHRMGMLAWRAGDLAAAQGWHQKALDASRLLGDKTQVAMSLGKLGDIARRQGRTAEATLLYRQSAQISEESGRAGSLAITYTQLGALAKDTGDLQEALSFFRRSFACAEKSGRPLSESIALGQIAEVQARMGMFSQAEESIEKAIALAEAVPDPRNLVISHGIRVDVLIASGRADEAEIRLREIEFQEGPSLDEIGRAFNLKRHGLIAMLREDADGGRRQVEEAMSVFRSKGNLVYAHDCETALLGIAGHPPGAGSEA
jgi:tetratricopeptide (TPR) repeat protein